MDIVYIIAFAVVSLTAFAVGFAGGGIVLRRKLVAEKLLHEFTKAERDDYKQRAEAWTRIGNFHKAKV